MQECSSGKIVPGYFEISVFLILICVISSLHNHYHSISIARTWHVKISHTYSCTPRPPLSSLVKLPANTAIAEFYNQVSHLCKFGVQIKMCPVSLRKGDNVRSAIDIFVIDDELFGMRATFVESGVRAECLEDWFMFIHTTSRVGWALTSPKHTRY